MKNNYFLVCFKDMYFYKFEDKCIQPLKKVFFTQIIRKICNISNMAIPKFCINKEIFNSDKLIFTDSAFDISLYKTLLKYKHKEDLILYYMNTVNKTNNHMMKYFDNIYTFDFDDATKYNIKFKHTPFTDKIKISNYSIIYDTLFLGRAKNRIDDIYHLLDYLNNQQLVNNFLVLDSNRDDIKLDKYLSYEDYLNLIEKSKCIVEINITGQSGCSLRFMESLFLHRKLITNNAYIVNDPYYDKKNVYIIGNDDREIKDFINDPYFENKKNMEDLIFSNWIETF